jgi:hypothetical protein
MSRNHFVLTAVLVLAACGGGKENTGPITPPPPPPPPPPTVASITVSAPQGPLAALGATQTLTAEVRMSDGSIGTQVPTWTSSTPNVATVTNGVVTAVGNGQATITATVGTVTGQATVTVAQVIASVRLLPGDTVIKSTAAVLRGTALDSRNNPVAGAPVLWESLTPNVVTVSPNGNLTPVSTGVGRVRFTSGTFTSTAIVRTVHNVTQLSVLFPLFEYTASNGQRRAISDVSQAHADVRAVAMGSVWSYMATMLPSNGGSMTDMYFTSWIDIWTEFLPFCGGQLLVNQTNWTSCAQPHRQHFFRMPGTTPDDFHVIARFLARQYILASHTASNQVPWFLEGHSQWLGGGSVKPNGEIAGKGAMHIPDFRLGDTQNLLAPLDTLIRLPNVRYFENLPQRTPVAVRMAQSVMLVSYLTTIPGNTLCRMFAAIRNSSAFSNDQMIALMLTATGKTMAEIETGYLAHARAMTAANAPEFVVPVSCP